MQVRVLAWAGTLLVFPRPNGPWLGILMEPCLQLGSLMFELPRPVPLGTVYNPFPLFPVHPYLAAVHFRWAFSASLWPIGPPTPRFSIR